MNPIAIGILLLLHLVIPAYASHSSDPIACQGDGLYDGKNNPFSQKLFEMCGYTYYDGFIGGCMSEDNSREVCEQATDAQ
jgi:hypothetical protein